MKLYKLTAQHDKMNLGSIIEIYFNEAKRDSRAADLRTYDDIASVNISTIETKDELDEYSLP